MIWPPAILLPPDTEVLGDLAGHGVPLVIASEDRRDPSRMSRHVVAAERAPGVWSDQFEPWFEDLLRRYPGAVVIPGSDPVLWWLDEWRVRRPDVSARLAVPPRRAVQTVTAKFALHEACLQAGLAAPRTWLAPSEEAAVNGMGEARFPVTVKPQSRVGNTHWGRGQLAKDEAGLREAVGWALANVRFREPVVRALPGIDIPMVQEFIGGRDRPVYHLCGYLSVAGDSAVLAHTKLLQVPRRFGSGLCLETAPVDIPLAERLLGMLRGLDFHGIFEAEFVSRAGEGLLIDLNTRVYNGMALERERGLPLALYAYLEAAGEHEALREEILASRALPERTGLVWCRKLEFAAMVAGQAVGGGFRPAEVRRWLRWYWEHRRNMVDPGTSRDDRRVGRARLRHQFSRWARAPRQFFGAFCRRESGR